MDTATPKIYPDIDALNALRYPSGSVETIRAELLRQARIIIPLLKDAGRLDEWMFWAQFVAYFAPLPKKRRARR